MFGNNKKKYIRYLLISLLSIVNHTLLFLLFNIPYVNNILYVITIVVFLLISNVVFVATIYKIRNKNIDCLHIIITVVLNSINVSLRLLSTIYIVYLGINIVSNINGMIIYNNISNVVQFLIGGFVILIITQSISLFDKIYTIKYYEILFDNTSISRQQKNIYVVLQFIPIIDILSFYFCICLHNNYNKIFKFVYIIFSILFCYFETFFVYYNLIKFM